MDIDGNAIMKMVLRDPACTAGEKKSGVSIIRKGQSLFIADLIANAKYWLRYLALVTAIWILLSTILLVVTAKGASDFRPSAPQDLWDFVYYVMINLVAGFDDYHPYSSWARLITVLNILFGLAIFGMIVAVFTSAMSPDTEVTVSSPQVLEGSVEIPQLTEVAASQANISREISSIKEILAASTLAGQATDLAEIKAYLSQEIGGLHRAIEGHGIERDAEWARIRAEIGLRSHDIFDSPESLFSIIGRSLWRANRLLERYLSLEERDEGEASRLRNAIGLLTSDIEELHLSLRRHAHK